MNDLYMLFSLSVVYLAENISDVITGEREKMSLLEK
jgi:hypothetical protein